MSATISGSLSAVSYAVGKSAETSTAHKPQPAPNDSGDTVKLSESQQITQLYNQGQKVNQIATKLSLPVDTVDTYLGISTTG